MEILQKIKENFSDVLEVYFEKEGVLKFLRVKTALRSLSDIETLSRKISDFIDKHDTGTEEFYLDVFSKGAEEEVKIEDLDNFIEKNLQVWLSPDHFILGNLLENKEDSIILKVNKKGRIAKEEITKEKINKINTYIKF
ncbi:ribosome assembly cofactor RimP [Mycoplasma procyoni]|uniref:ribosome assembly cofactor RimP n=1 Tax=Mycoplasma procyoni TaxID=568784 RepID=UPI00197BAAFF|nr:ribosome assembly cofactor RimP [Mycoplasma procyoni]MBN3535030.1 ribosome assembly cofactor RimP [Mycoplasma procyoni]